MKLQLIPMVFCVLFLTLNAGDFVNLKFDEGNTNNLRLGFQINYPNWVGDTSRLLPGWTVKIGGRTAEEIYFDSAFVNGCVTLIENRSWVRDLYGNYSISIWSVRDYTTFLAPLSEISIAQSGVLPESFRGLRYYSGGQGLQILGNGAVMDASNGIVDLSGFAGSELNLEFRFPSTYIGRFDILGFTAVPEPSVFGMLGLSLGLIGLQVWKCRKIRGPIQADSGSADCEWALSPGTCFPIPLKRSYRVPDPFER